MSSADTATVRNPNARECDQDATTSESTTQVETRQAPLLRPAVFNPNPMSSDAGKLPLSAEDSGEGSLPVKSRDKQATHDDTAQERRSDAPTKRKKRTKRVTKAEKDDKATGDADVDWAMNQSPHASAFSIVGGVTQPVLPTIAPGISLMPAALFARAPLGQTSVAPRLPPVINTGLHPPVFSVAASPQLATVMQSQYLPGFPIGPYASGLLQPAAASLLRLPFATFPMSTVSDAAMRAAAVTSGTVPLPGMPSLNLPSAKSEQQVDSGFFSDHSNTSTPTATSANSINPLQRALAAEAGKRKGKRKADEVEQEESESLPTSPKLMIDSNPGTPVEGKPSSGTKKQITEEDLRASASADQTQLGMSDTAKALLFCATECHLAVLQDDEGDTPLHLSIAQGNLPLTSYLVALLTGAKMNLDIFNFIRQTPLHLAVITRQHAVIVMLVRGGANVNLPDRNGRTCLHLAVESNDLGSVQALTLASNPKIDLEIRNFDGFTALHVAVMKASLPIAQSLLSLGASINAPDGKSGMTPLHHAVESKCTEMIQMLIKRGASVHSTTFGGGTALHFASGYALLDAIKILLASGANAKASNNEGDTPADVAPSSGLSQLLRAGDRRKGTA